MKLLMFLCATTSLAFAKENMNSRIAIVSKTKVVQPGPGQKKTSTFRPTTEQIEMLEQNLMAFLKSKHPSLHGKVSTYYRQYEGIEIAGESQLIHGNFLCRVHGDQWRTEWIRVMDGGDCYFSFSYDLKDSKIKDLYINGEA